LAFSDRAATTDRLARSVPDLLDIVVRAKAKGTKVEILNLGNLDPGSVNGKLILAVLGTIAAFQREMMLEPQRKGITRARRRVGTKAASRRRGRRPIRSTKLAAQGVSKVEITLRLGMQRATVYRALASG
jgi:DNA invertase Pin-like site-specific DNA recombinase